jgi:tetratricopeptide (TPR) repeat protein
MQRRKLEHRRKIPRVGEQSRVEIQNTVNAGESRKKTWQIQIWPIVALLVFAVVFAASAITSFRQHSPTMDEPVHLLGGYSYLKWGDFRVNPEHPPFSKIWAALPLLWLDIKDPRTDGRDWDLIISDENGVHTPEVAHQMFFVRNDAATLFGWAKLQMVLLGLFLAAFVFRWSNELFGFKAAVISGFLYCFDPNIIGHSTVIHSDLPFAVFFFLSTYFFWRALKQFTWPDSSLACLCFGMAAITKHSFIAIFPVWLILGLVHIVRKKPSSSVDQSADSGMRAKLLALIGCLVFAVIASYLSVWAAYGFRFNAVPLPGHPLAINQVQSSHGALVDTVKSIILENHLLPEAFVAGYLYNLKVWDRTAYLLGQISEEGFWSYFPIAFATKTPLPTLLLLIAAVGMWISKHRRLTDDYALIIPILVYFCLAILSRFNIGVRHLLPIYPFLFVLLGGVAVQLDRDGSRAKRIGLTLLAFWYLGSSLSIYPHYLAYFNELAGGPTNGHRVLLDSNLDWGQDLKGVKKWMDSNKVEKIQLIYFGVADSEYYGIDDFYSPRNVEHISSPTIQSIELPEYMAVSANFLYGGQLYLPKELIEVLKPYRLKQPVAKIGYSILVFKLNRADSEIYNNAGVILAKKEGLSAAANLFRQALRMDPANDRAHFNLAKTLVSLRSLDEAGRHYQEALRINPGFPDAHHDYGRLLAAQGDDNRALEQFQQALHLKPDFAEAHESLSRLFRRRGNIEEAIKHSEEALRILKSARSGPKTA